MNIFRGGIDLVWRESGDKWFIVENHIHYVYFALQVRRVSATRGSVGTATRINAFFNDLNKYLVVPWWTLRG